MMVASSVLLPTPLRPMIDSVSPALRPSLMSSSTTVSPYPEKTSSRSSARSTMRSSPMAFLAEVDSAHLLVVHDGVGRAFDQHRTLHQHRDFLGETVHHVHVMFDDQDGD